MEEFCEAATRAEALLDAANEIGDPGAKFDAASEAFGAWSKRLRAMEPPDDAQAFHAGWVERYKLVSEGYATIGAEFRAQLSQLPPVPPLEGSAAERLGRLADSIVACRDIPFNPFFSLSAGPASGGRG